MTDSVRCPACRGSKKVPKLGGMIGECNTCKGKGTILAVDKPVKVDVLAEDVGAKEIINAVANTTPMTNIFADPVFRETIGNAMDEAVKHKFVAEVPKPVEPQKVDPKKVLYRRKTGSK